MKHVFRVKGLSQKGNADSEIIQWAMWGDTIRGVTDFLTRWSFVEVNFDVYVMGYEGVTAEGRLMIA